MRFPHAVGDLIQTSSHDVWTQSSTLTASVIGKRVNAMTGNLNLDALRLRAERALAQGLSLTRREDSGPEDADLNRLIEELRI